MKKILLTAVSSLVVSIVGQLALAQSTTLNLSLDRNQFELVNSDLDLYRVNLRDLISRQQRGFGANQRVQSVAMAIQVGPGFPQLSLQTRISGNYFGTVVALENKGESYLNLYRGRIESQGLTIRNLDPRPTEALELYIVGFSKVQILRVSVSLISMTSAQVANAVSQSLVTVANLTDLGGQLILTPGDEPIYVDVSPDGVQANPAPAVVRPSPAPPVVRPSPPPVASPQGVYVKSCNNGRLVVPVLAGDFLWFTTPSGAYTSLKVSEINISQQTVGFKFRGQNIVKSASEVCK